MRLIMLEWPVLRCCSFAANAWSIDRSEQISLLTLNGGRALIPPSYITSWASRRVIALVGSSTNNNRVMNGT